MRSVLALGLLVTLSASADAAAAHRSKPPTVHLRTPQHVIVRPSQGVTAPARFAVPGWTDEETLRWLDNANPPADSPRAAPADASLYTELVNARPGIVSRSGEGPF
jgi:hypothetical protein